MNWATTNGPLTRKQLIDLEFVIDLPIFRDVISSVQLRVLLCLLFVISALTGFAQPAETALSYYTKGESLRRDEPLHAYPLFLKAVQLSKQDKDQTIYLKAVNSLSLTSQYGDDAMAKEAFSVALSALKDIKHVEQDSTLAELHYNLAEFYIRNDDTAPAIRFYESAKKIRSARDGEWNAQVARCYHGLGDIYKYHKFDFYQAEKAYERALMIRERIRFNRPKTLFQNYYSLATTNRSQRDYEKAVSYGEKALEMSKEISRLNEVQALEKAISRLNEEEANAMMGNIYRDMGDSKRAAAFYQNAINLNKRTKDVEHLAWYYQCSGESYSNDSLYVEANRDLATSYTIYIKNKITDIPLFINLLLSQLDVYAATNDDRRFESKAREVFRELRRQNKLNSKETYMTYLIMGGRQQRFQRYDSALYYYQKGMTAVIPEFGRLDINNNATEEQIGLTHYVYEALAQKAIALRGLFRESKEGMYLQKSIESLTLAEKLLSKARNALDMDAAKWRFLDANYDLYENILSNLYEGIGVLPADSLQTEVFRYFEQSKARSLADALTQTEQSKRISHEDSLFQLHTELKRELLNIQAEMSEAMETKRTAKELAAIREKEITIDRNIQSVKIAIEEKYPGYFNVRYGYQTPELANIQQIIRTKNQAILEYFWGTDWVYGIAISGDKVLFKRIGKPDSIKSSINAVLSHLGNERAAIGKEVFGLFGTQTHQLYKTLIEPFISVVERKGRLQVIPDGPIGQVPFEVLTTTPADPSVVNYRALNYLIKLYGIGYAYSSSMLIHKTRNVVRQPTLLAVGFTAGRALRAGDPELEEIMGAELELEALSKRFDSGKFLVGKDATEANFKNLSPEYDIIHLAIHGRGDVQRNFSSSLYFRSKYDSLDDGELHAYELYGLKLKAVMAVLTACESGLGKGYKGEGMISMASAFTYSGCENILMSLWKVNDQASTTLMDDFYSQLLEGQTIDDALRQAKLHYLETADELTADPKVWAPLVAYGSLDQVFQKERSWVYALAAGSLIVILLLAFKFRKIFF